MNFEIEALINEIVTLYTVKNAFLYNIFIINHMWWAIVCCYWWARK